jgi:predicted alpha/beta-hydrolase family hydrolase
VAIEFLKDGPDDAETTLILAHGAGAAMDTPFMAFFADRLSAAGVRVLRFEFPYMAARRTTRSRRPPDREGVLLDTWRAAATESAGTRLCIGGKSMGGRIASMVADELKVAGLVCLGYPFHPPGAPQKTRTAHLEGLTSPALIVQGTNDAFGTKADVEGYRLSEVIGIHWIEGGNHDLRAAGRPKEATWGEAADAVIEFTKAGPG